MPSFDINAVANNLASEGEVDFAAFADEPSVGAWPNGWYAATIIEGYATRNGFQFQTTDVVSQKGDSRNVTFCFAVSNATGETRNLQQRYNYRPEILLSAEGMAQLAEVRAELKGAAGKSWPSEVKFMQSSSITVGKLGQLQKALGMKLKSGGGQFDPTVFVGQKVDVKLTTNADGFNEAAEFAPFGTKSVKANGKARK